ncbi:MAG: TRAP transporter substrate-binding protein DctP, partial [Maribacter sp.]
SPTPISWGELYTSLQQGVVDGAENNPPSFYLSRHYEVCKFYSLDEHTVLPDVLLIGTYVWDKLTEQEHKWLSGAVKESVKYQRILWAKAEEEALREVQKAGVEIFRPDKTLFAEKVKPIYESYKDDAEIYPLIKQIQQTN